MDFFTRRRRRARPSTQADSSAAQQPNPVITSAPRYVDASMQQSFAHHSNHHRRARDRYVQSIGSSGRLHSLIRENDALRQQLDKQWIDIYNLSEENTKLAAQCAVLREQNRILNANEKMAFKCVHETTKQTKEYRQRARLLTRKNRHLTEEMVRAADIIEESTRRRHHAKSSLQQGRVQSASASSTAVATLIDPRPDDTSSEDPDRIVGSKDSSPAKIEPSQ